MLAKPQMDAISNNNKTHVKCWRSTVYHPFETYWMQWIDILRNFRWSSSYGMFIEKCQWKNKITQKNDSPISESHSIAKENSVSDAESQLKLLEKSKHFVFQPIGTLEYGKKRTRSVRLMTMMGWRLRQRRWKRRRRWRRRQRQRQRQTPITLQNGIDGAYATYIYMYIYEIITSQQPTSRDWHTGIDLTEIARHQRTKITQKSETSQRKLLYIRLWNVGHG